ncbi:thiol-disulfide oxidoreductase DCC family protein [Pseudomonas sp. W22_MBD1_FP4]|uniref:thiol-disulfide oxidoreductase DCC family protein n=1 Tax=Pseudomonas sp. W22_MBD1_FP4 TaxID=3240272 RepID=UPI003F9E96F9
MTLRREAIVNAPFLRPGESVVLFDGVCKLCNRWVKFIIRHDREHRIRLASVQSPEGQILLAWAGFPVSQCDTIVVISNNMVFVRSEAFFEILSRLPRPWRWLTAGRLIPTALRDWLYNKIALNRYRLFGRYDSCLLPSADHERRFL